MLAAANTIRRSVGHKLLTKLSKQTNSQLYHSNLTSKSKIRFSYSIFNKRNSNFVQRFGPAAFGVHSVRAFSTEDHAKNQNNDEEDDDDGDDGDDRVSRLPALFSVPEVWPRLPIITNKSSPIFPNFMKIFEVSAHFDHAKIAPLIAVNYIYSRSLTPI